MFPFFGRRNRKLTSGTADHPTPQDVFRAMIVRIVEEDWEHVTFEADSGNGWAQVAPDKPGRFVVNFKYPFVGGVQPVLAQRGISLPQGSEVVYEDSGTAATITFSTLEGYLAVAFLDEVFVRLFGCLCDYVVTASLD